MRKCDRPTCAVGCGMLLLSLFCLGVLLLLTSCEHKELCYDHTNHEGIYNPTIDLDIVNNWEISWGGELDWALEWEEEFGIAYDELRPELPTGIRVKVYREDGDLQTYNYPVKGGILHIYEPMDHSLLFYNNDTEYIVFNHLEDFAEAEATTRTRSRPSYKRNSVLAARGEEEEYTVGPPDMLFGNYIERLNPSEMQDQDTVKIMMQPLVFTYLVRYEFSHGLKYVKDVKGALAGMARSVQLKGGRTGKEKATILYDCEVKDFGAQSLVKSFGIPDSPNPGYNRKFNPTARSGSSVDLPSDEISRSGNRFGLTLEVVLKNGLRKNFDFDITDQLSKQPYGGVIIVKDIEVPDEAGNAGDGGFGADVEDWGDVENVEIPLDKDNEVKEPEKKGK